MPVLNGYYTTQRIRIHDTNVPIVAITGIEEQCNRMALII